MNLPFLRYFKWGRAAQASVMEPPPAPAVVIEKPASERFGKTVQPNVSRFVGLSPLSDSSESMLAGMPAGMASAPTAVAPAFAAPSTTFAPRTISLGNLAAKPGAPGSAKGPA